MPAAVAALDAWRRKRNRATYDLPGAVSEHEVRGLTALVVKLKAERLDFERHVTPLGHELYLRMV